MTAVPPGPERAPESPLGPLANELPPATDYPPSGAPPPAPSPFPALPAAQPGQLANGSSGRPGEHTQLLPVRASQPGPHIAPDPGLYAVLGLDPGASDAEIQTTYRRQAARLRGGGSKANAALRQLNVAYEVLGNPVRRAEYDRLRLSAFSPGAPTPIRPDAKSSAPVVRRRRPRHAVQPHYAGRGDLMVVLMVVGVAVLVGALIIPRLSINLSPLNALQGVLPLSNNTSRRVIDATVAPATPTPVPIATPLPAVVERFAGTTLSISNPAPAQNTPESVVIKLRRDNQPAANVDVWATVRYLTIEERWPATGSVKTDASGAATITFNIGDAIPNRPVPVQVFARVDDQQVSWSTTFTPH